MGRLPRLLDSQFKEVRPLHPTGMTATINRIPLSTASMSLPEGEPPVGFRAWVELFAGEKSLGIFRTRGAKPGNGPRNGIRLEHGLCTLGDDMTAADTTLTGTPRAILSALLGYQLTSHWVIGAAPDTGSYELEVDRTYLLQGINDLVKMLPGYMVYTDQNSHPWTISLVQMPAAPTSECRLSRNIANVDILLDDSELYTRVYALPLENGHLDADTVDDYGYVAYDLGLPEDADAKKAHSYAQAFLDEHKHPRYAIEIDAVDLSQHTGEPLDSFGNGGLCRVALPDWGVTVDERIISMSYSDPINAPEKVRLTLSTAARDTSRWMVEMRRNAQAVNKVTVRNGYGVRSNQTAISEVDRWARFVVNESNARIELNTGAIDKVNNRVKTAEEVIDAQNALIADRVTVSTYNENKRLTDLAIASNTLWITETGNPNFETLIQKTTDNYNAIVDVDGKIDDQGEAIYNVMVQKDEIIASINLSTENGGTATINAAKVDLGEYATVGRLETVSSKITNLTSGYTKASLLKSTELIADHASIPTLDVSALLLGETRAYWRDKSVVTSVTKTRIRDIYGSDHDVVTSVTTSTLHYLGY